MSKNSYKVIQNGDIKDIVAIICIIICGAISTAFNGCNHLLVTILVVMGVDKKIHQYTKHEINVTKHEFCIDIEKCEYIKYS